MGVSVCHRRAVTGAEREARHGTGSRDRFGGYFLVALLGRVPCCSDTPITPSFSFTDGHYACLICAKTELCFMSHPNEKKSIGLLVSMRNLYIYPTIISGHIMHSLF